MDDRKARKISRKIKRCEETLLKHRNVKTSKDPTNVLFIGNGGLGCGLKKECLMSVFEPFGVVQDIVLLPGEPYSFVVFGDQESAERALRSINGETLATGQVFYMSFICNEDVPRLPSREMTWPPGLIVIDDFLTNEEEEALLTTVAAFEDVNDDKSHMKHRKVKHYGYEFNYSNNNIDRSRPLDEKIPDMCFPYLESLVALGHLSRMPDQLTVNHYKPGQGIPPHIDTHSAFEDGIVSISLGSQVIMDFCGPQAEAIPVLLPRRSALVMTGESRYSWRHGITPRKTDVVPCPAGSNGQLTLSERLARTSLTFRIIRNGACDCVYKEQCDSQREKVTGLAPMIREENAADLEKKYVSQVYEEIADHFNRTRYRPWPRVVAFLRSVPPGSVVLDVGCGNGKNFCHTSGCFQIGCDASLNLVQICSKRHLEVLTADCLKLPFKDDSFDVVISIAVIHHMSTQERRLRALQELLRVLRPGGQALVYAWAFEQQGIEGNSKYLKKNRQQSSEENSTVQHPDIIQVSEGTALPVHVSKTSFRQQDMLVPWKKAVSQGVPEEIVHRFYHMFLQGELETLVQESGAYIKTSYYDEGNWCVLFRK